MMDDNDKINSLVNRLIEINREGYLIVEELEILGVDKDGDSLY